MHTRCVQSPVPGSARRVITMYLLPPGPPIQRPRGLHLEDVGGTGNLTRWVPPSSTLGWCWGLPRLLSVSPGVDGEESGGAARGKDTVRGGGEAVGWQKDHNYPYLETLQGTFPPPGQ